MRIKVLKNYVEKEILKIAKYAGISSIPIYTYEVPKPDNLPEMLQKVKKEMEEDEKIH